jgi:hypothetical protein
MVIIPNLARATNPINQLHMAPKGAFVSERPGKSHVRPGFASRVSSMVAALVFGAERESQFVQSIRVAEE